MNIADSTYSSLYNLIVQGILPALSRILSNPEYLSAYWLFATLVIAITGIKLSYGSTKPYDAFKVMLYVAGVSAIITNESFLMPILVDLFIDGPISMGEITIQAISSGSSNSPLSSIEGMSITPNDQNITAFGRLWEISTGIGSKLLEQGGFSDLGAFFLGILMYGIGVALLVVQIFIMGAALVMGAIAVLGAPIFLPMILFKTTRRMFESWLSFGFGGAFGLYLLLIIIGLIVGFCSQMFLEVFDIDIATQGVDDIDNFDTMGKLGSLVLFMIVGIKMIPFVSGWASSLAGFYAMGLTETLAATGGSIASQLGFKVKDELTKDRSLPGKSNEDGSNLKPDTSKPDPRGELRDRSLQRAGDKLASSISANRLSVSESVNQSMVKDATKQRLLERNANHSNRPLAQLSQKENRINNRVDHSKRMEEMSLMSVSQNSGQTVQSTENMQRPAAKETIKSSDKETKEKNSRTKNQLTVQKNNQSSSANNQPDRDKSITNQGNQKTQSGSSTSREDSPTNSSQSPPSQTQETKGIKSNRDRSLVEKNNGTATSNESKSPSKKSAERDSNSDKSVKRKDPKFKKDDEK
ncbi:type IV secretion system protein [Marinicella sp. W31]|uniref:type IV secretion system protein n=1 Tax=Marinicella sp. W31 TaxID=3023713 RepID=UPI003756D3A4